MNARLVSHPKPIHRCRLPGWWWRRKHQVQPASVIECAECGARWVWAEWQTTTASGKEWQRLVGENTKEPRT